MNWVLFAITTYLLLAIQGGFAEAWVLGQATPNLLLVFAVFIGLSARPAVVAWSLLLLGVLLDLQPGPLAGRAIVLGPHALGFLVGAYAILQLRNLLFRESVFTMVLMTLAVGSFAALVEVLLYALRGMPMLGNDPTGWRATEQLGYRLFEVLYSAAAAIPLGWLLNRTRRWWGFTARKRQERIF